MRALHPYIASWSRENRQVSVTLAAGRKFRTGEHQRSFDSVHEGVAAAIIAVTCECNECKPKEKAHETGNG